MTDEHSADDGNAASDDAGTTSPGSDKSFDLSAGAEATRSGFVAILGKPNTGKSTLLNTLLGVKVSPITPKPQTTRRGVRGIYTLGKTQIVFVDTPGWHRSGSAGTKLDEYMHREVRGALVDVEVILWVVDLRRPPSDEDKEVARLLQGIDPNVEVWLVGNKVDAAKYPDEALTLYGELGTFSRTLSISAMTDPAAVYDLREDLLERMPEGPLYYPDNIRSDQTRESWASELIRESAMIQLREELPYAVAVRVSEWREPDTAEEPIYIAAEIWVERRNHRPMVIGKGGKMIREIGRNARRQLEVFLDHKIFLDLEVVVQGNWREDREALRELGYES